MLSAQDALNKKGSCSEPGRAPRLARVVTTTGARLLRGIPFPTFYILLALTHSGLLNSLFLSV